MPHINAILAVAAREFILSELQDGTEKTTRWVNMFDTVVEDTGQPYDPSHYPLVEHFLGRPADPASGARSIRGLLTSHLISVAEEHSTNPQKPVAKFLRHLEKQELADFLDPSDDAAIGQREQRLRRKLDRLGRKLVKSRTRNPLSLTFQQYDVIGCNDNAIFIDAPLQLAPLEVWVDEEFVRLGLT